MTSWRLALKNPSRFPPDSEGRSLFFRVSDLAARWILIDLGESVIEDEGNSTAQFLDHSILYLTDRLAYELFRKAVILEARRNVEQALKAAEV